MADKSSLPKVAVAEKLYEQSARVAGDGIPKNVRSRTEELFIDVVGLCVAARKTDYMQAVTAGVDASGNCTAIGHAQTYSPD